MRSGALISAVCHIGLVSLVMLSTPRQFGVATEKTVEAELVRADEVDLPKLEEPKPEKPAEKPNVWDFPEEKLRIELPDFSTNRDRKASPQSAAKPPEKAAPPPAKSAPSAAKSDPAPSPAPQNSQQAALSPNQSQQSSIAQQAPSAPAPPMARPSAAPSVFDPANIPMLMELPNAQGGAVEKGFDFEATVTANISADERAAFKAQLRKCWKLPDGLSPAANTRVVLRVYLKRDGALSSEPVLIEASASRDGPAVLMAAKAALAACQPYALPTEKYREWRILDLTFTPRDMAGG
jgi:hypothetical protein